MEEKESKPTKKRAAKKSTKLPTVGVAAALGAGIKPVSDITPEDVTAADKKAATHRSLSELIAQYAAEGAEARKNYTKNLTKAEAEELLEQLGNLLKEKQSESDKFEVLGAVWRPKEGKPIRTIFIDDKIFVEFPLDDDGKATAFFPYEPYSEQHGGSVVTFPADWLVLENGEQLIQMGSGAATVVPDYVTDAATAALSSAKQNSGDDCVSIDELADEAIRRFGKDLMALFS